MLERVEFRRADSCEDKQAIFRMRYEAYSREGYIEPNATGLFTDADDERPNTWLIAVYIDRELASSIRLHIGCRPEHFLPVTQGFPDIIAPRLAAGQLLIDASRQTSRLELTRSYPFMPYITMRAAFVAEQFFAADFITAACREEYQAAFRRMGGAVNWAAPRPYPPLKSLQALMAYDCRQGRATLRRRYPFSESTPEEQRALFGRSSNAETDFYAEFMAARGALGRQEMQQSTASAA